MSDQTFRSQRAASPTNSVDRQLRTSAQHIVHKVISNARESLRSQTTDVGSRPENLDYVPVETVSSDPQISPSAAVEQQSTPKRKLSPIRFHRKHGFEEIERKYCIYCLKFIDPHAEGGDHHNAACQTVPSRTITQKDKEDVQFPSSNQYPTSKKNVLALSGNRQISPRRYMSRSTSPVQRCQGYLAPLSEKHEQRQMSPVSQAARQGPLQRSPNSRGRQRSPERQGLAIQQSNQRSPARQARQTSPSSQPQGQGLTNMNVCSGVLQSCKPHPNTTIQKEFLFPQQKTRQADCTQTGEEQGTALGRAQQILRLAEQSLRNEFFTCACDCGYDLPDLGQYTSPLNVYEPSVAPNIQKTPLKDRCHYVIESYDQTSDTRGIHSQGFQGKPNRPCKNVTSFPCSQIPVDNQTGKKYYQSSSDTKQSVRGSSTQSSPERQKNLQTVPLCGAHTEPAKIDKCSTPMSFDSTRGECGSPAYISSTLSPDSTRTTSATSADSSNSSAAASPDSTTTNSCASPNSTGATSPDSTWTTSAATSDITERSATLPSAPAITCRPFVNGFQDGQEAAVASRKGAIIRIPDYTTGYAFYAAEAVAETECYMCSVERGKGNNSSNNASCSSDVCYSHTFDNHISDYGFLKIKAGYRVGDDFASLKVRDVASNEIHSLSQSETNLKEQHDSRFLGRPIYNKSKHRKQQLRGEIKKRLRRDRFEENNSCCSWNYTRDGKCCDFNSNNKLYEQPTSQRRSMSGLLDASLSQVNYLSESGLLIGENTLLIGALQGTLPSVSSLDKNESMHKIEQNECVWMNTNENNRNARADGCTTITCTGISCNGCLSKNCQCPHWNSTADFSVDDSKNSNQPVADEKWVIFLDKPGHEILRYHAFRKKASLDAEEATAGTADVMMRKFSSLFTRCARQKDQLSQLAPTKSCCPPLSVLTTILGNLAPKRFVNIWSPKTHRAADRRATKDWSLTHI